MYCCFSSGRHWSVYIMYKWFETDKAHARERASAREMYICTYISIYVCLKRERVRETYTYIHLRVCACVCVLNVRTVDAHRTDASGLRRRCVRHGPLVSEFDGRRCTNWRGDATALQQRWRRVTTERACVRAHADIHVRWEYILCRHTGARQRCVCGQISCWFCPRCHAAGSTYI